MKQGADWYARYPTLYLGGVQGMTAKQHAVYGVIIDLIYQHGGSVNNDPQWISGWIKGMGAAAVRHVISDLQSLGKISVVNGQITQKRATETARTKESLSRILAEAGREGGIASGVSRRAKIEKVEKSEPNPNQNRTKTEPKLNQNHFKNNSDLGCDMNENKDLSEAYALSREEKRREEKKEYTLPPPLSNLHARDPEAENENFIFELREAVGIPEDRPAPPFWAPESAAPFVTAWLGLGLDAKTILAVAAETRKDNPTPPNGPKALDKAMKAAATAAPKVTQKDIDLVTVAAIISGKRYLLTAVTATTARRLVDQGLVTLSQCQAAGVL